jgi:hypothetical protein
MALAMRTEPWECPACGSRFGGRWWPWQSWRSGSAGRDGWRGGRHDSDLLGNIIYIRSGQSAHRSLGRMKFKAFTISRWERNTESRLCGPGFPSSQTLPSHVTRFVIRPTLAQSLATRYQTKETSNYLNDGVEMPWVPLASRLPA